MRLARTTLLLACLGALGCRAPETPDVRLGLNPWPAYELFYLASERGLYDTSVVDVHIVELTSLSDTRRAFERRQVDAFLGTTVELLKARETSRRSPVPARVLDQSAGADVIITRAGIRRVADLRGRRVGVEPGTLNVYVLARALELAGLSLDEVEVVPLALEELLPAFAAGTIDAVVTYPPVSVEAGHQPGATVVFTSSALPGEIVDLLIVDSAFATRHAAAMAEVVRGYDRALQYLVTNPDDAMAVMAGREGLPPGQFAALLHQGLSLVPADAQEGFLGPGGSLLPVLQRTRVVLERAGMLRGSLSGSATLPADEGPAGSAGTGGSPQ